MEIDRIYALAGPQTSFAVSLLTKKFHLQFDLIKYNEEEEIKRKQREKQKRLNQYELMRQYKEKPTGMLYIYIYISFCNTDSY